MASPLEREGGNLFSQLQIISELQIVGYVVLAMFLSALIGVDRELADKPAGFRTHMLVGGASALLVSLSSVIVNTLQVDEAYIQVDPIRVLEAIIAGVSFLGAGTIFRRGSRDSNNSTTEGLTTAASLLFVAGIGVSVATHQFVLAIGVTLMALIVLRGVPWLESRINSKPSQG